MFMNLMSLFNDNDDWKENCNCSCTMAESPDFEFPGEPASNPICVNNTFFQDGAFHIDKREWFWSMEIAGMILYFPLLVFAVHNVIMYLII